MYKYNPLIQFIAQLIMSYGASVGWALAAHAFHISRQPETVSVAGVYPETAARFIVD